MQKEAQGRGLLKVTGILMIIGAAFSIIMAILLLLGGGVILAFGKTGGASTTQVNELSGLAIVSGLISIVGGVFELVAGVLGVSKAKVPNSAKPCLVFGIIVILLSLCSAIFSLMVGTPVSNVLASVAIGLILPVLYMIGASKNIGS